jgi:hypothetical protein
MVSPVSKEGADIVALIDTPGFRAGLFKSAASGEKLTFSAYRPFGAVASAPYTSQYIASRSAGVGWSSEAISPGLGEPLLKVGFMLDSAYRAFSEDLCQGWLRLDYEAEPALDPAAIAGLPNLYRRQDCAPGAGSYEALTTVAPVSSPGPSVYGATLDPQGTSADGSVVAFTAPAELGGGAPAEPGSCISEEVGCVPFLYVRGGGGETRFVCVLPSGTASAQACLAGSGVAVTSFQGRRDNSATALSEDGNQIVFSTGGNLYLRTNATAEQSAVTGGECTEAEKACTTLIANAAQFWAAAADGSRVLYTAAGVLREYDVEAGTSAMIAASGVQGVLGQSKDASRVYFASTSLLAGVNAEGKAPVKGEANLYFHEAGEASRFVGGLSSADLSTNSGKAGAISPEPVYRASRVTPDGLAAAFVSSARPTGYDNADAESGEADGEVFLYDARGNEGEGKLICPSCDPSGARPSGRVGKAKPWQGVWSAAWIPTWEQESYPSRPLSENGQRLFFNSFTPLLPRDTNGKEDVYEWEAASGRGGCEALGAERYIPAAGGCISLISSGGSSQDSEFLDADPSGNNVFLATGQSLLSQDPGLIDIYDARVEGGLPAPGQEGGGCEGQACQGQSMPPAEVNPASSSYEGPEAEAKAPKSCPKGSHRVKRHCAKNKKKGNKHKQKTKGRAGR